MRKEHQQVVSLLRQSFEYWTYDYFCTNGATSAVYSDTIGLFSAFLCSERRYIFLRDEFAKTLNSTDREIYYLLEKGITQKEIAKRLGYKTHSAVSKRMKIMNKDFKIFLGFEN